METLSMEKVSEERDVATAPAPAGRTLADLEGLEDKQLLRIVRSQPLDSPQRVTACELLVARHRNLVRSCVQRYKRSPEPIEDLMQVGYVGLLKAINNFDPDVGGSLAAYAQPCISGEIKRHFRDKRWQVHVERSMQELVLQVREATRQLTQQLGHQPGDAELIEHLGISDANLREARRADMVFQPASLAAPLAGRPEARGRAVPPRPAWQTCLARRTRRSSTPWTWNRWPRTGVSCPAASRRSCCCGSEETRPRPRLASSLASRRCTSPDSSPTPLAICASASSTLLRSAWPALAKLPRWRGGGPGPPSRT